MKKRYAMLIICAFIMSELLVGCNKSFEKKPEVESVSVRINEYLKGEAIDICYNDQFVYGVTNEQLIRIHVQNMEDRVEISDVQVYPIGGSSICAVENYVYVFSEEGYIYKYTNDNMREEERYCVTDISKLHMYMGDETRMLADKNIIIVSRGYYDESISSDRMRYFAFDVKSKGLHEISDSIYGCDDYSYLISLSWIDDKLISLVTVATNDSIEPEFRAYIYNYNDEIVEKELKLDFWASDCVYDVLQKCYIYSSDGFTYYSFDPNEGGSTSLFSLKETGDVENKINTQNVGKLLSVGGLVIALLPQNNTIEICHYR